jgi:hypothetical protein
MRHVCRVAWLVLPLLGCGSPPAAGPRQPGYGHPAPPRVANLALGSHPEHVQIGGELTYRSDWPAVRYGYVIEDVASFFSFSYDDQSFYDRFGGGYFSLFEATRQGVIAR